MRKIQLSQTIRLFIKAQASAQTATLIDFLSTYVCLQFFHIYYIIAAAVGSILGGLTDCIINYKWTFRVRDVRFYNVLIRYILVWMGSASLNVWGVYLLKNWFQDHTSLWVYSQSLCVMLSKLIVAVLVAIFWNFLLHRYFVFRKLDIAKFKKNT